MSTRERPVPIVVMGVAGVGKTTVARALAQALEAEAVDADDLHSPENIAKMAGGTPLDDADRMPWLAAVGEAIAARPRGVVVACSALRRRYRDVLRAAAPDLLFVHLSPPADVLEARLATRTDHFMPARLLASQLATLEELGADEAGMTVAAIDPPDEIAAAVIARLPSTLVP